MNKKISTKVLLMAFLLPLVMSVGCEKEAATPTSVSATTHNLESRTDGDSDSSGDCDLGLSKELITTTTINGVVIPTFSSKNDFDAIERSLIRQCDQICLMNYDLIDLTEGIGYKSAWAALITENSVDNDLINEGPEFSLDHVKKSLMNADGFTRVGDILYHWKNPFETYAIGIDQDDAYGFLSTLDEEEIVEYEDLLEYKILIEDSDLREIAMMMGCSSNTDDDLFGVVGPVTTPLQSVCNSPLALTSGFSMVYKTDDVQSVNGTISWGDGMTTTVNFTPPSSTVPISFHSFPKTYSSPGAYEITYTLQFNFGSSAFCVRSGAVYVSVGDGDCSQVERTSIYYLNEFGETTNFEEWASGVDGLVINVKKGRTIWGSRLKGVVMSGAWNGNTFRNREGNHDHTATAKWRNDECSHLGDSSDSESDSDGVLTTVISKTPKRRWKYVQALDLRLDFSVNFSNNGSTVSGTRYLEPRCR